jgi:hypothetical protein
MRWAGHVTCTWDIKNACNILVGKLYGKRPFARPRRRWEGNVKTSLKKKREYEAVNWIHMAQDRDQWRALVSTEMKHRIPYKLGYLLTR